MTESINITGITAPLTVIFTPPDAQSYIVTVNGLTATFSVVAPIIIPPSPAPPPITSGNKKIALVDYHYHNDTVANADMTAILTAKPDILIDCTPGSLWKGGTLPPKYASANIRVFSYITGGYEGTKYKTSEDNLTTNISRIDAIANDKATGVFIDEVTFAPDAQGKAYLAALCNEAHIRGLLVILNIGDNFYDDWLYTVADYICSNEAYGGSKPSTSESGFLARTIVLDLNPTATALSAISITKAAQANGYGWCYVTDGYNALPTWLSTYMAGI